MLDDELIPKVKRLDRELRELKSLAFNDKIAVAFSGGIDSAFLLRYAKDLFFGDVIAITVDSAFFPESECIFTKRYCSEIQVEQHIVSVDVLGDDGISSNPKERCYLCKRRMFAAIIDKAQEIGCGILIDGTNADDEAALRPGMRALSELGVKSPLMLAGLAKADIRALSRNIGIEIWDKPSYACLATRFSTGVRLEADRLHAVEQAEEMLHDMGFAQCRLRMDAQDSEVARIEVLPDMIDRIMEASARSTVVDGLHALGFSRVAIDLEGYGA